MAFYNPHANSIISYIACKTTNQLFFCFTSGCVEQQEGLFKASFFLVMSKSAKKLITAARMIRPFKMMVFGAG